MSRGTERAPWVSLRVTPATARQDMIEALVSAGSNGILEDGAALVAHFPPGTDATELKELVHRIDPGSEVATGIAPDTDWREWRASVKAHDLGGIRVVPPWLAGDGAAIPEVVIDPGMAFGTGGHASTRGVIRLMQQLVPMPRRVADLGAGSAVLAIAAALLGAESVAAIESDPDAIGDAERNVTANRVAGKVHVLEGDAAVLLPLVAPVELILANIISSVLTDLLPVMYQAVTAGGHAILSGILSEESRTMTERCIEAGFRAVGEHDEEGWWSVLLAKP